MHFGFALELPDIDLWNIDSLDTHLDLLSQISIQISLVSILFVFKISSRRLQDMSSRNLQDMSSRRLQHMSSRQRHVLKTSWRRLQDQQMFTGRFRKMWGKNPQLCPFTALYCPFLVLPQACPYFLE